MFEVLPQLPADPILGLSTAYKADTNPLKIDLGVGVYKDEQGHTPILSSVAKAQELLLAKEDSKTYITPQGVPGYIDGMLQLLLGKGSKVMLEDRVAAVQAPGGCGALRILAELIKRCNSELTVWVSDPTWANHIPLIGNAGLKIETYPYFNKADASINFEGMVDTLAQVKSGDVVLLHGCCHNPTGADLTPEQWHTVLELAQKTGFIPFVDVAYQGFGDGLEQDAYGLRLLVENLPEVVIAASCSKNFGLYRERVGLAAMITANTQTRQAIQTQIQSIARGIYSMPPSYGGALVDIILSDEALRTEWVAEVEAMRTRMQTLRGLLVTKLAEKGAQRDFSFVKEQKGMFSYLCITPEQVQEMRNKHSVYFVDSSRVNIAGISIANVDALASALVSVL
ncbi:amino acid aminotransferase [Paraglaciecola chathamensis]|jgi:aspartate aminotransferase|uniref:Aminotransferase n=3 Tax=Paraglaciecola chathamensis TaxID=368405 RepID=A0ABS0WI54_9ALTE|nr:MULTISPECIES: amino acid aminotransferase [Paraglaciecola]AEE21243.1 Aromatic-amino-acid transaminase [Glaciecola sp. 4H-3-7+YE-5]MBN27161.1 aspartate/tyrosine/aromatic aminotransferase [Alteromonadaceae bacterium]MBJ2138126.1 aspartate/tyrosine/aromatic aminotransferase [Paraglaciecola chathamensis]MBU3020071.1 aspartate/tyrosine/aromatic aminotransferase [Paraglaciecola agarilytica]MDO6560731.1 amino acid aminotransferase [Paraglaciecola chathamensis]|tara:strand:+ start:75854 stop:77044 length:1191 start_codon:yes stop_codon:yes gene_type:complete